MNSRWQWLLARLTRRLWVRASAFALLAGATALAGIALSPMIPAGLSTRLGADSVHNLLEILASSMLVVATFSLATMTSAYAAAARGSTPRAVELLLEDTRAQNALGTFVGGFLFSLVGIIGLSAGAYGENGRLVLFTVTLAVVAAIVGTFLRWIDLLSRLGQMHDVIDRVVDAASAPMRARCRMPNLGACPDGHAPPAAHAVHAPATGYVQHVDVAALHGLAAETGSALHLDARPGDHVDPSRVIARCTRPTDDAMQRRVRDAFAIGTRRSFHQDPRHGLAVLSEIGSRALSPGVNDPGSAIQVLDALLRVLALGAPQRGETPEPPYPTVFVPAVSDDELFDNAFAAIARDGAAHVEVGVRLQQVLGALAKLGGDGYRHAAHRHAVLALSLARAALSVPEDIARLEACSVREVGESKG